MRLLVILGLVGLSCSALASNIRPRHYDVQDYYVLHLDPDIVPAHIADRLGLTHEGQLGELRDHHIFSASKESQDVVRTALKARRQVRRRGQDGGDLLDGVRFAQKQTLKPRMEKREIPNLPSSAGETKRQEATQDPAAVARQQEVMRVMDISDPIFHEQWHLLNPIEVGHDLNVTGVWEQGITGHNATVAVVDDGLDMYSDDLKDNYFAEGSYDFNEQSLEPKPRLSDDRHGTRCAGEVSAVRNDVCGVGVAYDSKVAGLRILSKAISDADEAVAMNYAYQKNQIYSCSWGPPDDGKSMDAPGILIKRAMLNGVQNGRAGKGSIYVFASGNGAGKEDNCNFDGYTNSIYSITVGAIDRKGQHPYYSEKCSAQLVVTYSSGSGDAIHTTDVGTNACYAGHGGTSAAAPLAAGIFALVLSIRPDLTWRDMQYLVMQTALPVNLDTGEWQTTSIGKKYSHTFGYGKIDTWATIEAAKTFESVKPQAWFYSPWLHVNEAIPQGDTGLAVTFEVTPEMLKGANLERLEHVTVTMNVDHSRRGDLSVELLSPDGITSHLSATREPDDASTGYEDWTFMSVVHWGESGIGKWTVIVKDTQVNEFNGTFTDWHLKLWGECINPAVATLLPMPTDNDDDDHDETLSTTTLAATPTRVDPGPSSTAVLGNPTDHPDRPTKPTPEPEPKPSGTEDDAVEATKTSTSTSTPSASETAAGNSSWLPSFFPTFGLSNKTQIWVYGSLASMLVFCGGLGVYFYLARRKRLRSDRDKYEFERLDNDDEAQHLTHSDDGRSPSRGAGGGGAAARMKGRRRAGELYDAFAAGSEDESDLDDVEGGDVYRDARGQHVVGEDEDEDEDGDDFDEKEAEKAGLRS
ncbi:MAG: pheromone processing endoprotease [Claussenomyces sp. TS43310]|nr:MAG: pheromone processing endoprotease [Claussenomyces sp. TS43310]